MNTDSSPSAKGPVGVWPCRADCCFCETLDDDGAIWCCHPKMPVRMRHLGRECALYQPRPGDGAAGDTGKTSTSDF